MQGEESERRVVVVTAHGSVLRPRMETGRLAPAPLASVCRVLAFRCSLCLFGALFAVVALAVSVLSVHFFVGPHVARTPVADPSVCSTDCQSGWSPWALLFVCTFLKSLMGSLEDGSVVTWVRS